MDSLEQAAKLLDIQPIMLFREICDSQKIEKRRRVALWDGYRTELYLPPFVELSCHAVILGTTQGGIQSQG